MMGPERLGRRREEINQQVLPKLIGVDLNDVDSFRSHIEAIVKEDELDKSGCWEVWHSIFLFEGVLMYLKDGVASQVLRICADAAQKRNSSASLCFADRLEHVPGVDVDRCVSELSTAGWKLVDWAPNEHAHARHMGIARLVDVNTSAEVAD